MSELRNTTELKSHPLNAGLYGEELPDNEFLQSISDGIHTPLLITQAGVILSGHRRYLAAKELKLEQVPVIIFSNDDELAQKEVLIETNRQRHKTEEQRYREYKLLDEIEREKAKRRQATNVGGDQPRKNLPEAEKGKAADKAAEKIERSRPTAEKGSKVLDVIDKLTAEEKQADANKLRALLNNKSVSAAYNRAVEDGHIEVPAKKAIKATAAPAVTVQKPPLTMQEDAPSAAPPIESTSAPAVLAEDENEKWLQALYDVEGYLSSVTISDMPAQRKKDWQTTSAKIAALFVAS